MVGKELTNSTDYPNQAKNERVKEAGATFESVTFAHYSCEDEEWDIDTKFNHGHPAASIEVYHCR
jgi:hypothetical protein